MFIKNLFVFINCLCNLCFYVVDIQATYTVPEKIHYDLKDAEELFKEFVETFHRVYKDKKEYNFRFQAFKKALEDINKRNEQSNGEVYGITEFSDLTPDEFVHVNTGLDDEIWLNNTEEIISRHYIEVKDVPDDWDWRSKDVVTPARNQLHCNSCWSFSAVGCVESQYAKKHGHLLTLSEQQMVDCYKRTCQKGDWPHLALDAAAKMGGYMLARDYPYTGVLGICQFKQAHVYVKVMGGHFYYQQLNEEELKKLVYSYGPVSLGIHQSLGFAYYRGGIATAKTLGCGPRSPINHAVVLVGYGIENGVPYWKIKNSAGNQWGEQGFMRLKRGENTCTIPSYVAIADVI